MPEPAPRRPFGLYLHWPYCLAKCPYCDFNSHVAETQDPDRWARAYLAEIARHRALTGPIVLDSIFFGGGTPSLMAPALVQAVIDAAAAAWPMANDVEITLEANPTSVEAGRFRAFRAAGVNRVSIGVQALDDAHLRNLGRQHSVVEAVAATRTAREIFDRSSFDIIYARQNQTLLQWESELSQALALAGDHLSLYQLTIEDGTVFGRRHAAGRLPGLPSEDLCADMFDLTQQMCQAAGLPAYEISNHARPGAESRHNMIYWTGGDYAGIGPGAHGRLTLNGSRFPTEAPRAPGDWLRIVEDGAPGAPMLTELTASEILEERLMMGLRIRTGIATDILQSLAGYDDIANNINDLVDDGLLEIADGHLRATARGRSLLNHVLAAILT